MGQLAKDIGRISAGRVTFDARRRRLTVHEGDGGKGGVVVEIEVTEAELRNGLQRLLLATPHEAGQEPQDAAIRLLLARLEVAKVAAEPRATLMAWAD